MKLTPIPILLAVALIILLCVAYSYYQGRNDDIRLVLRGWEEAMDDEWERNRDTYNRGWQDGWDAACKEYAKPDTVDWHVGRIALAKFVAGHTDTIMYKMLIPDNLEKPTPTLAD